MVATNYLAQSVIWGLGSNLTNQNIQYLAIGSGSGLIATSNTTLYAESGNRMAFTGSPDFTTSKAVSFQFDYSALQISGINLSEFGLFASGPALTGSLYAVEGFPFVNFDGTNELQITYSLSANSG